MNFFREKIGRRAEPRGVPYSMSDDGAPPVGISELATGALASDLQHGLTGTAALCEVLGAPNLAGHRTSMKTVIIRTLRGAFRTGVTVSAILLAALAAGARVSAAGAPPASTTSKLEADGPALIRQWSPPVYPAAQLKAKQSGLVTVRLVVDETGRVSQARALEESDEPFVDSALTAVKSWQFIPATESGQNVPCCLDTLVAYSPAVGQQKPSPANIAPETLTFTPAPRTAPVATVTPSGDYPDILSARQLPGTVRFSGVVTPEGRAANVRVARRLHFASVARA